MSILVFKPSKALAITLTAIIIISIAIVLRMICFSDLFKNDKKIGEYSLFDVRTEKNLTKFGFERSLDGSYELNNSYQFGYKGFVTATVKMDTVASITFTTDILTGEALKITEAEEAVADFVENYSKSLSFPLEVIPQKVRFADEESYKACPDNDYEALIKGYLMFEYSYRDTDGILWIVQIYSPRDNILSASVMCHPDDSGFTDFEAQVNLDKEVME